MRMSDLQNKKIVNINDGKEIGIIIDITIDNEGKIINFIVEKNKFLSIVTLSENYYNNFNFKKY